MSSFCRMLMLMCLGLLIVVDKTSARGDGLTRATQSAAQTVRPTQSAAQTVRPAPDAAGDDGTDLVTEVVSFTVIVTEIQEVEEADPVAEDASPSIPNLTASTSSPENRNISAASPGALVTRRATGASTLAPTERSTSASQAIRLEEATSSPIATTQVSDAEEVVEDVTVVQYETDAPTVVDDVFETTPVSSHVSTDLGAPVEVRVTTLDSSQDIVDTTVYDEIATTAMTEVIDVTTWAIIPGDAETSDQTTAHLVTEDTLTTEDTGESLILTTNLPTIPQTFETQSALPIVGDTSTMSLSTEQLEVATTGNFATTDVLSTPAGDGTIVAATPATSEIATTPVSSTLQDYTTDSSTTSQATTTSPAITTNVPTTSPAITTDVPTTSPAIATDVPITSPAITTDVPTTVSPTTSLAVTTVSPTTSLAVTTVSPTTPLATTTNLPTTSPAATTVSPTTSPATTTVSPTTPLATTTVSPTTARSTTTVHVPAGGYEYDNQISASELTDMEMANVITLKFRGVDEADWHRRLDARFRSYMADLLTSETNRITDMSILYIRPTPVENNGVLDVSFIVRPFELSKVSSAFMPAENVTQLLQDNMDDFTRQLGLSEAPTVSLELPDSIKDTLPKQPTVKPATNKPDTTSPPRKTPFFGFLSNPGLFISLIIIATLSIIIIIVGLIYLLCDRRRGRSGEYITNHTPRNSDLELGFDNPVMAENDKMVSNGNGAHLTSIKGEVDSDMIVPYDNFTQEELMNYEVEDTHL